MALSPGTRLGPYEILAPLGAGGMGEDERHLEQRLYSSTLARSEVGRIAPEGLGAIAMIYVTDWVEDGRWYVYNYTSIPSTLFLVSGARP